MGSKSIAVEGAEPLEESSPALMLFKGGRVVSAKERCPAGGVGCPDCHGDALRPACEQLLGAALECERSGADGTVVLTPGGLDCHGRPIEVRLRAATVDGVRLVVGVPQPASLESLPPRDALTGLPNRVLLQDRLATLIRGAQRRWESFAVLLLDLDGFKAVNDRGGHESGDRVLRIAAQRMVDSVRESDTVARLGGDEFALVLTGVRDHADVTRVARNLVAAVGQPILLGDQHFQVGCSIGVAMYPSDGLTADGLLAQADSAMYAVKMAGKNGVLFYREVGDAALEAKPSSQGVHWSGLTRLGVEALDADHQLVLDGLNRAVELIQGATPDGLAEAHGLLRAVFENSRRHFEAEEDLLRARGSATLGAHRRAHQGLLAKLERISQHFSEDCGFTVHLVDFLVDHIETMDIELATPSSRTTVAVPHPSPSAPRPERSRGLS